MTPRGKNYIHTLQIQDWFDNAQRRMEFESVTLNRKETEMAESLKGGEKKKKAKKKAAPKKAAKKKAAKKK